MTRSRILSAGFCASAILFACAPDIGPFFKPQPLPEDQSSFDRGRLGLLTPALSKENEMIAFRLLSGLKIAGENSTTGGRLKAIVADPGNVPVFGQQAWEKARRPVTDPPPPVFINAYRSNGSAGSFVYYENCMSDAFDTAARTLEDRRKRYTSPAVLKAWVAAQDQVFSDCSAVKPAYPEPLSSNAPLLERADRDYQIAAAHFYAEDFDGAEKRFKAIAAGPPSPWQHIANYLVARTLLRKVSLRNDAAAEPAARLRLQKIASDASAASLAKSAEGLLQRLDAIEDPDVVFDSVSKQLLLPRPDPPALQNTLQQSHYLLTSTTFSKALSEPGVPQPFDWVLTLERGNKRHAFEQWKSRRSLPWLALSLMFADKSDPESAELIQSADRLSPESPAFGTAAYNAVRLRIEQGEVEQPRKQLDALLAAGNQPDSLINGWRAERMRLAASFEDFLRWAPRKPIDPWEPDADSPILAPDAAYVLNYRTPLSKLALASHSVKLAPWSTSLVALSTWTRAFMLNNDAAARDVAPILAKAHPDWASSLAPESGPRAGQWKFRAALLMALHRDFQPLVPVEYRKPPGYRLGPSWWCPVQEPKPEPADSADSTISWRLPVVFTPPETVISQDERTAAAGEIAKLGEIGSAQAFLAPIILDWAKAHPEDPSVPEALHRLVVVVRYGCFDPANGAISKTAFDLLHSHYPRSPWTAKTPYWFK